MANHNTDGWREYTNPVDSSARAQGNKADLPSRSPQTVWISDRTRL